MLDDYPETLMSIEWHNSSFTPGNSDFDIPEYSSRAAMYGVGGIPHTQWNGIEESVGGYANGNWQAIIGVFLGYYNGLVGDDTPYEIIIDGFAGCDAGSEVSYDIIVSMDSDMSNSNKKIDIFVAEDNIWSFWTGASQYHNARNVARDWLITEDLTINSEGESETFSGSFYIEDGWNADSVKVIAIVQDYASKQIYQVSAVNINDMNPDIDDDNWLNCEDNCIDIYNPEQEDSDGDLIGDVCDPCDNLVYILGNINGDTDDAGIPVIDVMDVISLVDYLLGGGSYDCQVPIMNVNGDEFVNVVDVIALVQSILNGNN